MTRIAFVLAMVIIMGCNGQQQQLDEPSPISSVAHTEQPTPEPDSTTLRLFTETMTFARENRLHERPIGEIMTTLGERYLHSPYEAGMLDVPGDERLICRLDAFDCVTFVESTLAMARAIEEEEYGFDMWAEYMRDQRYRSGDLQGYCSRLHYFSEWILDNEERGTVENITRELGGIPLRKELDFMSTHRESYPRLAQNDSLFQCIQKMERRMQRAHLYYIPQDEIKRVYDQLRAGDIVALATNIKGLDVTHTGLVYDNADGTKGLLHASTNGGVKVSLDLQAYVQGVDRQIGIIVARPQERAES